MIKFLKSQVQSSGVKADQRGVILVGALVTMVFFMVVTLAIIEFATNQYASSRRSLVSLNALSMAESGAEYSIVQLNTTGTGYTGTSGESVLYNDSIRGKGTYETTISNGSIANEKVIASTGRIYLPASSSTPMVTRKVRVVINQAANSGFTIQGGPGGITLSNNANVPGPVYTGGKLTMDGNASISGGTGGVYAQDMACSTGSGATLVYPVQCNTPYSISATVNAKINQTKNVYATNGVYAPDGLCNINPCPTISNIVPAVSYPVVDHATVTTAHSWTTNAASSICGTIAANTHFTRAAGVSTTCTVTALGDLWFDGPFILGQGDNLVASAALVAQPKLIIDGWTSSNNCFPDSGSGALQTCAGNTISGSLGWQILSFYAFDSSGNTGAPCNPNCTTLTGAQLNNSQSHNVLYFDSNFSAGGSTTIYTRWGGITFNGNSGMGQVIGQRVKLLSNASFSGNRLIGSAPGSWRVDYWEQIFN